MSPQGLIDGSQKSDKTVRGVLFSRQNAKGTRQDELLEVRSSPLGFCWTA